MYDTGKFTADDGNLYYYKDGTVYKASSGNVNPIAVACNEPKYQIYHDGYLYYYRNVVVDNETRNDGKVYRVSVSGDTVGGEEIFYDGGENIQFKGLSTEFAGKYFTVPCQKYTRSDDGTATAAENRSILVVDTETSEGRIIDY